MITLFSLLLTTLSVFLFACASPETFQPDSLIKIDVMSFETKDGKESVWAQVSEWGGNSGGIRSNGF